MGSVTLSQTNLEAHDQIWSFLNKEQLEDLEDLEGSVCDFSLDSEELYEEESSELSEHESRIHSQVFDSFLGSPNNNDPFDFEFENSSAPQSTNDFSDLVPHLELYNDNFLLEVQEPVNVTTSTTTTNNNNNNGPVSTEGLSARKRSICQIGVSFSSSSKKPKNTIVGTVAPKEVEKPHEQISVTTTQAIKEKDDFTVESDEEVLVDGSNSFEQKLTKMISRLEGRQLERALEIMSENITLSSNQRTVFDLSKMNQSKLLKLHDFVSKCNSFDMIDDDDEWSDEIGSRNSSLFLHSTPLCSPTNTRPNTPSPFSAPSSRMGSPSPFSSPKSVFSQNKAKEERLKDIISASQPKLIKKNSTKASKIEGEEIDILT